LNKSQTSWDRRYYDQTKDFIEKAAIKAPSEGIIVYQKGWRGGSVGAFKEGDQVHPGSLLMTIPDLNELLVVTQVDETQIEKVKKDQEVRVKVDAVSGLQFSGKIISIGNLAIDRTMSEGTGFSSTGEPYDARVFEVTVALDKADEKLRPGMTCSVDIILEVIPDAIYVPLMAIHVEGDRKYVYIVNGVSRKKREVVTGKENEDDVIIREGVRPGEEVRLLEEVT
jgi:RND family efflux transporter MFP subunit